MKVMAGIATLLALLAGATECGAQQWPARAVKVIVPYPAGGNVDGAARIIANRLQETLGQPFVIENKSGAGGMIAGEAFAKSPPDGYTLFVGANGPVLFAPEIAKRDAYQWKRDFMPVTSLTMTPLVLEVHPSVAAKTFKEFVDLVRSQPGKLTMASPGAGTTNHLLSELMQEKLGLSWVTAHYRGNAPASNDLLGGQVQFAFDQISVGLPFIKAGGVRALAVTGARRASWIPDVPTFRELGYPDVDGQTFTGLFTPAGTPPEVAARIADATVKVLQEPDTIAKFNALGSEVVTMRAEEFTAYLSREDAIWIPVVRKANIKAD